MDTQDVKNWPCQQLVREVCHELTQHAAIAASCIEYLCDDEVYRVIDKEQKEVLIELQKEVKIICNLNNALRIWHSEKIQ